MANRRKKKLERDLEESCRLYTLDRGWISRKMNGMGFRSWPDRFFLPRKGRKIPRGALAIMTYRFWVEFKREGETSTPDQTRVQNELRMRGEAVYEIDNKEDFIRVFNKHNAG